MMNNKYLELTEKIFDTLKKNGVLKEFRYAMMARAEMVARDLVPIMDNDDRLSLGLRGELAICIELADGAKAALDADEAKAKAESAIGIQQEEPLIS